jgi:hypothetical protein
MTVPQDMLNMTPNKSMDRGLCRCRRCRLDQMERTLDDLSRTVSILADGGCPRSAEKRPPVSEEMELFPDG